MEQEILEKTKTLEISNNDSSSSSLNPSRTVASISTLNPNAPLFVPRSAAPPPPPSRAIRARESPVDMNRRVVSRYPNLMRRRLQRSVDLSPRRWRQSVDSNQGGLLSDEIVQKITKQVEYYFSDINLVTTEQLMKFISIDPEGFVPVSVVASFKKIKALVPNNALLAYALRTSPKLVVNETGKRVKRKHPISDLDVKELQSRIVVAENLPRHHSYRSLMIIFSTVGSVKTIRTCYPQNPNGLAAAANKSGKPCVQLRSKMSNLKHRPETDIPRKNPKPVI